MNLINLSATVLLAFALAGAIMAAGGTYLMLRDAMTLIGGA